MFLGGHYSGRLDAKAKVDKHLGIFTDWSSFYAVGKAKAEEQGLLRLASAKREQVVASFKKLGASEVDALCNASTEEARRVWEEEKRKKEKLSGQGSGMKAKGKSACKTPRPLSPPDLFRPKTILASSVAARTLANFL